MSLCLRAPWHCGIAVIREARAWPPPTFPFSGEMLKSCYLVSLFLPATLERSARVGPCLAGLNGRRALQLVRSSPPSQLPRATRERSIFPCQKSNINPLGFINGTLSGGLSALSVFSSGAACCHCCRLTPLFASAAYCSQTCVGKKKSCFQDGGVLLTVPSTPPTLLSLCVKIINQFWNICVLALVAGDLWL